MSDDRYQLIDFGGGRKLESLAGRLIDRPSPAAEATQRGNPKVWKNADSIYDASQKSWSHRTQWPESVSIDCGSFRMPVHPTPYGHIGLFPEQHSNWQWLSALSIDRGSRDALNLFAYTGASTMALVSAGFRVAHVDAAKPNVDAARSAANLNGWTDPPIRFLVDDAAKFAAREVRRGRNYHTIVLDPPAYGHSPKGKAWRLERDLWPLLESCFQLLDAGDFRLLVTGHSQEVRRQDVVRYLQHSEFLRHRKDDAGLLLDSGRSQLADATGRLLDAGFYVRVEFASDARRSNVDQQ